MPPQIDPELERYKRLTVLVTRKEKEQVIMRAKETGLPQSEYIRKRLLRDDSIDQRLDELHKKIDALAKQT